MGAEKDYGRYAGVHRDGRALSFKSAIEWMRALGHAYRMNADVWNMIEGCEPKGEGCRNCWAASEVAVRAGNPAMTRFHGLTRRAADGRAVFNGRINLVEKDLLKPLRTTRATWFFSPSRSDLYSAGVPSWYRDRAWAVMALARSLGHRFLDLSKAPADMLADLTDAPEGSVPSHPERVRKAALDLNPARLTVEERDRLGGDPAMRALAAAHEAAAEVLEDPAAWARLWPLDNVWCGTSIWDQPSAMALLEPMSRVPAVLRVISYEPALGPIDLPDDLLAKFGWLISGGESAAEERRRDMPRETLPRLADQCERLNVAFFAKQDFIHEAGAAAAHKISLPEVAGRIRDQVPMLEAA